MGKDVFCARLSFEQIDRNFFKRIGEKTPERTFKSTLIFDILERALGKRGQFCPFGGKAPPKAMGKEAPKGCDTVRSDATVSLAGCMPAADLCTPCAGPVRVQDQGPPHRVGLTATKKVGHAVQRNRARRVMKAAIDEHLDYNIGGYDLVFVARSSTPRMKSWQLSGVVARLFAQAGLPDKPLPRAQSPRLRSPGQAPEMKAHPPAAGRTGGCAS